MIVTASCGRSELLTKMTAITGKVYRLTASATVFAAIVVARYLFEKSIVGLSTSLISKFALGKQFFYLHSWK